MKGNGKRNYNEANDMTEEKILAYKAEHEPILEFTKIVQSALGGRELWESESFEEVDGRKGDIRYKFLSLIYAALVSCCVGVSVAHKTTSEFLYPDAVANLRYLTGDDLDMWPNYQTIGDAFGNADKSILSKFEKTSQKCFRKLIHSGRYHARTAWGYHVVLDGTDIAFFTEKHCDHCLTATYDKGTKNEKTFYFHKMLVARAYIAPGLSVAIGAEPISNTDSNTSKQDCENKAAIKLLKRIKASFPETHFLISGDALYANKTFIRLCICNHWNYLFTVKRGAQPTLCDEFEQLREHGLLDSAEISYDAETGTAYWSNEMETILGSDLPMNILQYKTEKPIKKGQKRAASKEYTHREYQMDMPELSKNHEEYDLDERKDQQKRKRAAQKAQEIDGESDRIRKALKKVSDKEAAALKEADLAVKSETSDTLKEGDVLKVTFMYITNIKISEHNICQLLLLGRSRWAIEEDFLRQKRGRIRLEHLRTLNENGMYIYFWLEQFADLMMQLYLCHSEVLKYAGTVDAVYDWLNDSFKHTLMEQSEYLSARVCLWDRNQARKEHEAHLISFHPADEAGSSKDGFISKLSKRIDTKVKKAAGQVTEKGDAVEKTGSASARDSKGATTVTAKDGASVKASNVTGDNGEAESAARESETAMSGKPASEVNKLSFPKGEPVSDPTGAEGSRTEEERISSPSEELAHGLLTVGNPATGPSRSDKYKNVMSYSDTSGNVPDRSVFAGKAHDTHRGPFRSAPERSDSLDSSGGPGITLPNEENLNREVVGKNTLSQTRIEGTGLVKQKSCKHGGDTEGGLAA